MTLDRLLWRVDALAWDIVWQPTKGGWACSRKGDYRGHVGRGRTGVDALARLLEKAGAL